MAKSNNVLVVVKVDLCDGDYVGGSQIMSAEDADKLMNKELTAYFGEGYSSDNFNEEETMWNYCSVYELTTEEEAVLRKFGFDDNMDYGYVDMDVEE